MDNQFSEKNDTAANGLALVVGGSSGIGLETARRLVKGGQKTVLVGATPRNWKMLSNRSEARIW